MNIKKHDPPPADERNLEQEILDCAGICDKCRSDSYAQNLYAALCNMRWQPVEIWPILQNESCAYSWRHAGGIVAEIRNRLGATTGEDLMSEDYCNWYCSGMVNDSDYDSSEPLVCSGFVREGSVTEEITADMAQLGWRPYPYDDLN